MKKKLLLIVNPTSGKMRAKNELMAVCKTFCDADFSVNIHVTRCQSDATRVVIEEGKAYDVIVACGGDGTLNEVVAGALKIEFDGALGFLPCGTTNDLANTIKIPKNLKRAAEMITYEGTKPLDFGVFNQNRYFSYVASFGAFTDVAYSTDQKMKNVFGHAAYVTEAIARLKDLRPYHMKVTCDGVEYEDDFLFGATANTLSIGGVLKLKKDQVDLRDGFHEVLLIRNPKTPADMAQLSVEMLSGVYENKSVLFFRGKKILFESREALPWCLDGEYAGMHTNVEIQNLQGKLHLICP